jgi:hypothetical protein
MKSEMREAGFMFRYPSKKGEVMYYYYNRASGEIFAWKEGLPSYWQRDYPHHTEYQARIDDVDGLINLYRRISKASAGVGGLRLPHEHLKKGEASKALFALKRSGFEKIWSSSYFKYCVVLAERLEATEDAQRLKEFCSYKIGLAAG